MDIDVADIDHLAIRVSDLDEALEFYHDVLGMRVRDRDLFDAGDLPFVAVVAGGRHLHLVPTDDPIETGQDHVCLLLRTGETDTSTATTQVMTDLREAGYTIEADEPRERLGAYGRDWSIYVHDPDGRLVELKLH